MKLSTGLLNPSERLFCREWGCHAVIQCFIQVPIRSKTGSHYRSTTAAVHCAACDAWRGSEMSTNQAQALRRLAGGWQGSQGR